MMIFNKAMPRRTFLRGVGTTIALPLLDSMVPVFAATRGAPVKPVLRAGYIYLPVGRIMDKWTPKTEGAAFEFPPTLAPLEPFRQQVAVVSGLDVTAATKRLDEAGGNHARPCAAFLTGVHPSPGAPLGVSVDQIIARRFGRETQLASLELGLDPAEFNGGDEGEYPGYYQSTVSWRSPTTPLPTENNPRRVFERLFGDSDSTDSAVQRRRTRRDRSILDSVMRRVSGLSRGLDAADRVKLNEYLEAIRDVERRIQVSERTIESQTLPDIARPTGIPGTATEHTRLLFDLQVLAFQSDMTRVVTFMFGHESTNRTYKELGAGDGHHSLSHHKNNPEAIGMVERIDRFQTEQFAYLLKRLQDTPDGDGSLLDHSLFLFGSSLSDGNRHSHKDVPIVLAGGAGGRLKGGRHHRYAGTPLTNLHLSMLDILEVSSSDYLSPQSDATGKLAGLMT